MKKILVLLITVVILFGIYLFLKKDLRLGTKTESPKKPPVITTLSETNYTASFAIFTNGTFRIFTATMYHNLSEDVYIQADNPNIVHIKKSNITWDDFFKTLPFELTKDCLITGTKQTFCTNLERRLGFYLNGKEDPSALDKHIEDGDQLLVTYGNEDENQIQKQLQQIRTIK